MNTFLEFERVSPSQIGEFNRIRIDRYAFPAVYHTLLMKAALKNLQMHGDPQKFIQEYDIDFLTKHSDCRFHSDLSVFRKKGLYLPPDYLDEGHYFSHDPLNVSGSYLSYRSHQSSETIALGHTIEEICNHQWTSDDFSDIKTLQQGLIHGQLLWRGTLSNFKHYEESTLAPNVRQLKNNLFDYYKTQIGPIQINEGNSVADFTVKIGDQMVHL